MKIHIVQRGDTLWSIADKYQVSFDEVKKMNAHLANPDMIVPGMKIKLPETAKQIEKSHPYTNNKPYPCPPQMEEMKKPKKLEKPEELKEKEFVLPEQWMAEPAPAPTPVPSMPSMPFPTTPPMPVPPNVEHEMMPSPGVPVPCYFYPVPYPMPYMLPYMHEMDEEGMKEKEECEKMEYPDFMPMMPRCPFCHR